MNFAWILARVLRLS